MKAIEEDINGISLENLSIGYTSGKNRFCIAKGLVSHAKTGNLTCLIGRNGTGKSTLLRTITGLLAPLEGRVLIGKTAVSHMNRAQIARNIAIVITSQTDNLNLTAREMVAMGRTPYTGFWGHLTAKDISFIDEAMTLTNTTALADKPIKQLSDGERQKIMIAKALAQQTPVIILDEPTAFLDYPSKLAMMQLLASLAHNNGKTILLSTHDIEITKPFADSYWILTDHITTTSNATMAMEMIVHSDTLL